LICCKNVKIFVPAEIIDANNADKAAKASFYV